jgi:hypothetical protein
MVLMFLHERERGMLHWRRVAWGSCRKRGMSVSVLYSCNLVRRLRRSNGCGFCMRSKGKDAPKREERGLSSHVARKEKNTW